MPIQIRIIFPKRATSIQTYFHSQLTLEDSLVCMLWYNTPMSKPDLQSSFIFRGETITTDWYDAKDITELPDVTWQQVYVIGNVNGKVPVVHYKSDDKNLPGGQFDEPGDTIERVLDREMREELNMRVISWHPIGYQYLSNDTFGNSYQLRVYAELEVIGDFVSDPGGGVVGHSLVSIDELNSVINYGDIGERIVNIVKKEFTSSYTLL